MGQHIPFLVGAVSSKLDRGGNFHLIGLQCDKDTSFFQLFDAIL
jgi:hypothetical protein